jgi:hypothetical protein
VAGDSISGERWWGPGLALQRQGNANGGMTHRRGFLAHTPCGRRALFCVAAGCSSSSGVRWQNACRFVFFCGVYPCKFIGFSCAWRVRVEDDGNLIEV